MVKHKWQTWTLNLRVSGVHRKQNQNENQSNKKRQQKTTTTTTKKPQPNKKDIYLKSSVIFIRSKYFFKDFI